LIRLIPAGGRWADHDKPPVVVVAMVEPAPVLPVSPTATQSVEFQHEMPVRSMAFDGGFCSDQVEPLLDVPTTYGVELRLVPTATHVVSTGHEIPLRRPPEGMDTRGTQVEKLTVSKDVGVPLSASAVATHVDVTAQFTDVNEETEG
jgi:hypothetical protein